MTKAEVLGIVRGLRQATQPGLSEDGSRVHIRYAKIPGRKVTARAVAEAQRAADLGLPHDTFTGRISRLWRSKGGDVILSLYVELERDHTYRSLNLDKGTVQKLIVLGA
jgi:hypothetical protein